MKMHVAVAGWLLEPRPSGATRRLLALLDAMAPQLEQGEEITVLHRSGEPPPHLRHDFRWRPIDVPAGPSWRRVLAERRLLARTLEHLGANLCELGTLPVPPRLPCPVSLTIHDVRDMDGWRGRPRFLVRTLLARSLRRATCVTVPSRFTADRLRTEMGAFLPPIRVVPGGVDETFLRLIHAPVGRPYFLHVGHLEPRKNLLMLLSAYAGLADATGLPFDRLPGLYLVGADHGCREELVERAAMLDLGGHAQFVDVVSEADLLRLYGSALAVLVPSLHEGFGLPALEGLAAGLPVLVSDRGALPEVVGEHGLVLPAEQPGAWAEAMADLVTGTNAKSTPAERRAWAAEFSWSRAAGTTLELWRELVRREDV
jgi:glycosyltransferase involved in cell wall biosynthesis